MFLLMYHSQTRDSLLAVKAEGLPVCTIFGLLRIHCFVARIRECTMPSMIVILARSFLIRKSMHGLIQHFSSNVSWDCSRTRPRQDQNTHVRSSQYESKAV